MGKLKGEPFRQAGDEREKLYVQTAERDGVGTVKKARHYIVLTEALQRRVDAEPDWAAKCLDVEVMEGRARIPRRFTSASTSVAEMREID